MNKKGFTLIELLGVIILLGIITTIAITGYSRYLASSKRKAFTIEENNIINATRSAYADCISNGTNNSFCLNHPDLDIKFNYQVVYLKELIDNNYIDLIKNPYNVEQSCDTEKSYVYVSNRNNKDDSVNSEIIYKACLICGDHKSIDCLDEDLDYSVYDTTCNSYYNSIGNEKYDGKWTDQDVVLDFGASGNYRYGINEFIYSINGSETSRLTAKDNMGSLVINNSVGNKEYKVQAYDGMNNKGTLVSCGNIKIDKGTINSVNITAAANNTKIDSNSWVNVNPTLTVDVNPTTSVSGYLYQWYLNGEEFGKQTSANTLIAQKNGNYQVEVTNQVGKIIKKSNEFAVKIDTLTPPVIQGGTGIWTITTPTISVKTAGTATSGVKHYEYYKTNSSTAPNANTQATGTTSNTLTVSDNGTTYIYYRTVSNGGHKSSWSNVQIVKLDTVDPRVSASVSERSAIFTFSDNIGVTGYSVNQSSTSVASWTNPSSTTVVWTAPSAGTYYVWVKDASGRTGKVAFTISQNAFCSSTRYTASNGYWGSCSKTCGGGTQTYFETRTYYSNYDGSSCGVTNNVNTGVTQACNTGNCCPYSPGKVWEYNYTGGVQTFTVPCSGTYKIEVWGAQGGSNSKHIGGYGGYSVGSKTLNTNTSLYIVVGAQGNSSNTNAYNGGGKSGTAGGGGATHIATTNRGVLANYNSYRSEVLIVAGGGGGSGAYPAIDATFTGGSGGGTTGGNGIITYPNNYTSRWPVGAGGTQSAGGKGIDANGSVYTDQNYYTGGGLVSYGDYLFGSFGKGGDQGYTGGAGGGGWYGGGSGPYYNGANPGGGGSGYIGGVTGGTMSNGQRSGNGYAKITLITIN